MKGDRTCFLLEDRIVIVEEMKALERGDDGERRKWGSDQPFSVDEYLKQVVVCVGCSIGPNLK